jgi:hypothetical protein
MKNQVIKRSIFLVFISVFLGTSVVAQSAKKNTVRVKVQFEKIMNGEASFNIKASSRIDKKNASVPNIEFSIFNELEDENILLGKSTTNMDGESKFSLSNISTLQPDSIGVYNIKIFFKGNDTFKKATKRISFKNADIIAKLITKDSINYITATLVDTHTGTPMVDESLSVQVQRLFRALQIEEFNITDENGTIIVPIENGIPGIDGNLTIEVILSESDDFGTVIAKVIAPIGTKIVDESTFDDRTMWSPRNKTPLFLLIFPNLIIFGMWGLIIYLITNLFKITKS